MANDLIVRILGDSRSLERAFAKSSTAAKGFEAQTTTTLGRIDNSFSKLQRVAAGGFLGGVALTAGIRALQTLNAAATESQQVLGQTQIALESTGKSWQQYGDVIEEAIAKQSRLGFDDEALFRTFALFIRQSRDVGEALRRNSIAMNLARARFIDLEQAATLVNKAALGQAGALRRVGIDARNGASGVELLTQLEEQFAGAAEKASTQAVGAQDRLKVSIENTQEALGTLLLPVITEFAAVASDASDAVTRLVGELGKLGRVKIPTIVIPFTTQQVGGGALGSNVAKSLVNTALPGAALVQPIKDLINRIKGEPPPDTAGLAKAFDDKFDTFVEGIEKDVNRSVDKANAKIAAFGQKGFKPLEVNNLGKRLQENFDNLLDALDLRVDQAQFAGNTAAALAALDETETAIRARIATEGKTTELMRELLQVQERRRSIIDANREAARRNAEAAKAEAKAQAEAAREAAKAAKEAAKQAEQARQFRALGLSATGDEIVPGAANLQTRVKGALRRITSGELDVGAKVVDRLKLARTLLKKEGKQLTDDTRSVINDLLKTLDDGADKVQKGPLTKTQSLNANRILQGLGLSPEAEREARARLSSFNTAGRALAGGGTRPTGGFVSSQPIVVENHNTVQLDGDTVTRNVTKSQQKQRRRNPVQKRGPNSGA